MFILLCPGIFHFTLYLILLNALSLSLSPPPLPSLPPSLYPFTPLSLHTWPKTFTQSLMYTHTYPSKSKSQFGYTVSASVCVCVCFLGLGWGGCGCTCMLVCIHACAHYVINLKFVMSQKSPCSLCPQRKTFQLAERLWKESLQYTCTPL